MVLFNILLHYLVTFK